ncbi:hypothetical protein CIL05_20410 [Virgibacillus profundi]|uniref:Spore coat protein n=1 Tax=Virgibacillus profundi TaxID=2024555 RepID=A0A2A2I9A2_9BACI|nr:hypothetical protein [Virgibacillus profundi]PAV27715.1 hypothetical protein CIL05_20410 [Virgibacillus profundi]PXY51870.1 hypothetical protein CIT14_20630 [Virgibacillus profundi]
MRLIIFALVFLFSLNINSAIYAAEEKPEPGLIETYESDITGDGQDEIIELKGILFSEDASYYREIWAEITSKHGQQWKITYGGGYEPVLQFVDLNHDNINDIFYQSPTGGSGGLYNYQLNTLANEKLTDIPLPEQRYIKGMFEDNFNVIIQISPDSKPIVMDVKDRKDDYIRLGIYDTEGNLLKPKSVMIDPIAFFEPILISKSKGYGLKSYQQISGAYHADRLGTIETLWYYENNEWIILQTDWVPV